MALEPITRQEKIIAGQDLTPITRMEKFLKQYGGGGGGAGLPSGGTPYQQLVTDGDGNARWEDKPFYDARKEITLTFNPDDTYEVYAGMLYRISDTPIGFDEILSSKTSLFIKSSGKTIDGIVTEENVTSGEGYYTALIQSSNGDTAQFMSVYAAQTEENFGADVPVGLYVAYNSTKGIYVSQITHAASEVHPLDKKFIPVMDSVILNSSTSDSTKKFRITVDDTGTISATEVT